MRCKLTCRIVSLAKHKATIKNSVLRIILNNTSSIRKTSVIEPTERLNPKIFNSVNTSLTTLFIPNQLLRRQGKSLDYTLVSTLLTIPMAHHIFVMRAPNRQKLLNRSHQPIRHTEPHKDHPETGLLSSVDAYNSPTTRRLVICQFEKSPIS